MINLFQHFLITPFNVDIGIKPRNYQLDIQYLTSRLNLFEEVCYSSIYEQSNKNFLWLIFFDQETPDFIKTKINQWSNWKNFKPIYTPSKVNFYYFLIQSIQDHLQENTQFIITTGIDSDDTICYNFIDLIQQQFNQQEFEYINFPFGYILHRDGLFMRQYLSSPFVSLIEKNDNFVTCKIISHQQIFKLSKLGLPVRQIFTLPTWLQVVHDNNWLTHRDINAIPQSINKLKVNFKIYEFANSYLIKNYSQTLFYYLKTSIFGNKYEFTIKQKLKFVLYLVAPLIAKQYLKLSSKFKNNQIKLSSEEIKKLCFQQPNFWRRND
ncbi:glycosyltransferase [Aphanothece hegewaldii]|nr:glycosyltransferase [Aphanothece hegewaldii]